MNIQIINHNSGILIAGKNYPKNYLSFSIESTDMIKISGPDGNVILAPYTNFKDEFDNKYDSVISVIEDLGRCLGGDASLANKMLIDEADAFTTYIGYAAPGSGTNESKWMIQRITTNSASTPILTEIKWSVKRGDKTSKWSERTSLDYVS